MEYKMSIFKIMRAFEQSYVPRDFICREGELREIALCLEPAFEGYQALSAKITGEPAMGKTTAVKIVFEEMMEKTQQAAWVNRAHLYCRYSCHNLAIILPHYSRV